MPIKRLIYRKHIDVRLEEQKLPENPQTNFVYVTIQGATISGSIVSFLQRPFNSVEELSGRMFYGIKFLFQWVTEECENFGHVALVDDDIELDVEKIYLQLQKENQESGENLSYQL